MAKKKRKLESRNNSSEKTVASNRIGAVERFFARGSRYAVTLEWMQSFLIALILAMFIRTFFIQPYRIPTGSMIPTLNIGDHLLVNKLTYKVRLPQRGEVIVFLYPVEEYMCRGCEKPYDPMAGDFGSGIEPGTSFESLPDDWVCPVCGAGKNKFKKPRRSFIKRLVGLSEEVLEIGEGEGHIYINGKVVNKPPPIAQNHYFKAGKYGAQPVKIPLDSYYVLGDNVYSSKDSRYWGFVPEENLIGKALVVYWPIWKIRLIR